MKMFSSDLINAVRPLIKQKIINNISDLTNTQQYEEILNLLSRTIREGESNSALLIAPRNSGKTTLINEVLSKLKPHFKNEAVLVKLHGLVHTDTKLALKSITLQMGLENASDGKVFGTFADNLTFLLACLNTGDRKTSKSIIFILEEFDLFCLHHNQSLLYNLFDMSQSAQTPLCVLGLSSRLDVIELLEKRVKSRFSHRQIFLFHEKHKDLKSRIKMIGELFTIEDGSFKEWNSEVRVLISDKKFKIALKTFNDCATSEKTWKNLLMLTISSLTPHQTLLHTFLEGFSAYESDETAATLRDLNTLELCLLVSMKHHSEIYDSQTMNFEMIFTRFTKFANSNSSLNLPQRSVVMKAFEHLLDLELISMIGPPGSGKEYQLFKLLTLPQDIGEAAKKTPGLPTEVVQWAATSLL